MIDAELLADTNVVSYLFRNSKLGIDYRYLISGRPTGVTALTVEELHYGAAADGWGERRIGQLHMFLADFIVVATPAAVAGLSVLTLHDGWRVREPTRFYGDIWAEFDEPVSKPLEFEGFQLEHTGS